MRVGVVWVCNGRDTRYLGYTTWAQGSHLPSSLEPQTQTDTRGAAPRACMAPDLDLDLHPKLDPDIVEEASVSDATPPWLIHSPGMYTMVMYSMFSMTVCVSAEYTHTRQKEKTHTRTQTCQPVREGRPIAGQQGAFHLSIDRPAKLLP